MNTRIYGRRKGVGRHGIKAIRARLAALGVAAVTLLMPILGQAQFFPLNSYMYTTKFACGLAQRLSDVQTTGDPIRSPYEDLEPGRYATVINVFNTSNRQRSVSFFVAAQGLNNNLFIETLTLRPFETRRFGCLNFMDEVSANWPTGPLIGQLIEGFVYFTQPRDELDVEVIYSYALEQRGALEEGAGAGVGASLDVVKVEPRLVETRIVLPQPLQ